MKSMAVDFVPDHRGKLLWVVVAVICLTVLSWAGWRVWESGRHRQEVERQVAAVQKDLAELRARASQPVSQDPRQAASALVARALSQDLNKVFAAVENLAEPNTRLRNLSFDAGTGMIRLEYEMDSIPRASSVTAVLNAGFDRAPWQLEAVAQGASGASGAAQSGQFVRGTWSAKLDQL